MSQATADGRCPRCGRPGAARAPCIDDACARLGVFRLPADLVPEPSADSTLGRMFDMWLVLRRLGQGGMGAVYLAEQQPVGLLGALKLVTDGADRLRGGDRFMREAAALARLSHPHIVRLMAYGVVDAVPYLVMEYVPGGKTLGAMAAALDTAARRRVIVQITHALEAAHADGIVHRDLKPDNVMLQPVAGDPHFVRLVDFGLAKFTDDGDATAIAAGTPRYMAPEQALQKNIGPWTDVYATGVLACELFTGHRPFGARTVQQTLLLKMDPAHDPLTGVAGRVPPALAGFLRRAMASDPRARFADAAEMRAALPDLATLEAADLDPPLEPTAALEEPAPAPVRRWPLWVAGVAGAGGLLALTLAVVDTDPPRGFEPVDATIPIRTAPDAAIVRAPDVAPIEDAAPIDATPADATPVYAAPDTAPVDAAPDAARRRASAPRPARDPGGGAGTSTVAAPPRPGPDSLTMPPPWTKEKRP